MKNKIFAYSILGLNVVAAWVSWRILADALYGRSAHSWLYPALAFSLWGIAFTLSCIFIQSRKYLHSCYIFSGIGYLIFFPPGWTYLACALTIVLLIFTERWIKQEIRRGIKIDFYHLVSHSLKYFVSIACLVIAIAYYFSITSDGTKPTASGIEAKSLQTEIDWGLKAASFVLPEDRKALVDDVSNNVTVDEFILKNFGQADKISGVSNNVANSGDNPTDATRMIGDATAQKIRDEMLSKAKSDLSKQLGVNVVGEQPIKEVLMAYIDKTERSFFENTGSEKFYVPVILAFGIFLTARILGTAVDILLGLFVLLIIFVLRKTGIVGIRHEQREIALIEYSV